MIGSGSFGIVYKTHRKKDHNSLVAIKVLDKHLLGDHIVQIVKEVEVMNRIDHPNIVKYFETYDDNKYLYLVMQYVEGEELFDKITEESHKRFTEKEIVRYMN